MIPRIRSCFLSFISRRWSFPCGSLTASIIRRNDIEVTVSSYVLRACSFCRSLAISSSCILDNRDANAFANIRRRYLSREILLRPKFSQISNDGHFRVMIMAPFPGMIKPHQSNKYTNSYNFIHLNEDQCNAWHTSIGLDGPHQMINHLIWRKLWFVYVYQERERERMAHALPSGP